MVCDREEECSRRWREAVINGGLKYQGILKEKGWRQKRTQRRKITTLMIRPLCAQNSVCTLVQGGCHGNKWCSLEALHQVLGSRCPSGALLLTPTHNYLIKSSVIGQSSFLFYRHFTDILNSKYHKSIHITHQLDFLQTIINMQLFVL